MTRPTLSPQRRRALQLLGVTAFHWTLASRYAHAQSSTGPGPEQLRIGYQKSAVNLVILKQQGVLEKRFPGTRVSWLEFPAGPQLLEALSVGSLEFGLTGDSPPVFAQAAGKDLLYVGAEPPKPDSSALLVLKDSPLRTLADLKGRRIAVQKGSSAHYLLVKAVERAGLQWADIQPVYLAPADARAAFERKSVDAWAIWDPFYAATELAIQPRVLATGRGGACSPYFCQVRCDAKGPGARSQTKLGCGPSEAWQRRGWLFGIATRREGCPRPATRRCAPSQGARPWRRHAPRLAGRGQPSHWQKLGEQAPCQQQQLVLPGRPSVCAGPPAGAARAVR
uniref:aliphatic sulfonate ABC transporter substrate-binding protein n=1 Tax=uncultured Acidovorax sp. TaxID=158751 RepID=UPI0030F7C0E3